MANKVTSTAAAILVGAAIGTAIGVLFAPDKGSKTRRKIKDKFDSSSEDFKDSLKELKGKLKYKANRAKADLESTFDEMLQDVDAKKEDVIATLERKLEELKAKTQVK
ncbi:MAG: YtxH domain-containing protein [Bacteroidota bacterium]|nr:YtxH domain-containing protein [Bacteroidota bacterium]